jgi:predicted membrane protein
MSYPSYPYGYMYPNEVAVGLTWLPIIATYMLFVSIASGSAILLSLGVLLNIGFLRRLTPLLLMLSLATGLVYLLGPLADLRRPERAFYILVYPHLVPSDTYPGVSLIALMAGLMWPLLVILLVVLGYITLYRGMWGSIIAKILALALAFTGIVWSTYFAPLQFTTIPLLRVHNLTPLIPVELLLESIVLAGSITLLALLVHYRSLERSITGILSQVILACSLAFIAFRIFQVFRLYTYMTGSPEVATFIEVFSTLNTVVLILAVLSSIIAVHVHLRGSAISASLLALLSLLWVFVDRWLFSVNIQSISKTSLSVIPVSLDLASWALESTAMTLLALFVYYVLYTWVIREPLLKLEGSGGGVG